MTSRTSMAAIVLMTFALVAGFAALAEGTLDGEPPANEGVCDALLDATPGLYGLCVAFCKAQDCEATFDEGTGEVTFDACKPSSPKLLDTYNERTEPGDPPMPCVTVIGACPCWTEDELALIGAGSVPPDQCGPSNAPGSSLEGFDPETNEREFAVAAVRPGVGFPPTIVYACAYLDAGTQLFRNIEITFEQFLVCLESVGAECIARGWDPSSCDPIPFPGCR